MIVTFTMTHYFFKDNKPEMEKRRRSRINESLSCLKLLVLGEVQRKVSTDLYVTDIQYTIKPAFRKDIYVSYRYLHFVKIITSRKVVYFRLYRILEFPSWTRLTFLRWLSNIYKTSTLKVRKIPHLLRKNSCVFKLKNIIRG